MLLSMTGFGEASRQNDSLAVSVEVRTINSRYFKLTCAAAKATAALEPQIDALVRQHIKRGTVQVSLRVKRLRPAEPTKSTRRSWPAIGGSSNVAAKLGNRPSRCGWKPCCSFPAWSPTRFAQADATADWPLIQEASGAMANMAECVPTKGGR